MGRVEDLAERFGRHMQVPVSVTGVAAERVLIVVYDKELERPLRERFGEFQNQAEAAGRRFRRVDCTTMFADWMASLAPQIVCGGRRRGVLRRNQCPGRLGRPQPGSTGVSPF